MKKTLIILVLVLSNGLLLYFGGIALKREKNAVKALNNTIKIKTDSTYQLIQQYEAKITRLGDSVKVQNVQLLHQKNLTKYHKELNKELKEKGFVQAEEIVKLNLRIRKDSIKMVSQSEPEIRYIYDTVKKIDYSYLRLPQNYTFTNNLYTTGFHINSTGEAYQTGIRFTSDITLVKGWIKDYPWYSKPFHRKDYQWMMYADNIEVTPLFNFQIEQKKRLVDRRLFWFGLGIVAKSGVDLGVYFLSK